MAKLGINGKVVDITNIASKSKAQFRAQLKQAGVEIDDERLEKVYTQLHEEAVDREATKDMSEEETKEYFAKKYPEQHALAEKIRKEAEAKALAALKK